MSDDASALGKLDPRAATWLASGNAGTLSVLVQLRAGAADDAAVTARLDALGVTPSTASVATGRVDAVALRALAAMPEVLRIDADVPLKLH